MKKPSSPKKRARELTDAEMKASDHIKRMLESLRGTATQEEIAVKAGVTQGQIWQWANRRLPVPANRAKALAEALGTTPALVSAEYASLLPHFSGVRDGGAEYNISHSITPEQQAILNIYAKLSHEQKVTWRQVGDALAQQASELKNKEAA